MDNRVLIFSPHPDDAELGMGGTIVKFLDEGWEVILAYRVVQELAQRWNEINLTVAEGIHELTTLCTTEMRVNGKPRCHKIPQPRPLVKQLLKAASVCLPDVLPCKGTRVATRKKLPGNRATP
jgi:hypothetical protein